MTTPIDHTPTTTSQGSDAAEFWDQLLSSTLLLRFEVTDKALALETLRRIQANQFDPMPGLRPKDIIVNDVSERSREALRDLRAVIGKYQELR